MPSIDVNKIKSAGQRFLSGFTTGQKVVTGIALVALLAGAMLFSSWESSPAMTPLFTGLSAEDASAITQELDAQGVPYELSDSGTTVMVPTTDVYSVRIDLAGQDLPGNGTDSWSLLDDQSITTSEFMNRVDYQRALQGELGNTIMAMDNVEAAQVNLTLPRDDVFVGSENPQARAAVLVRTPAGRELGSEQVDSIVHLVTASVPDLTADMVTVSDQAGQMYKELGANAGAGGSRNFEAQVAYESGLESKVEQMLARTLGPGAAVVAVSATLNFDKQQQEVTTPQAATEDGECLVSEEQTLDEEFEGSAPVGQGEGTLGPDGEPLPENGATGGDSYTKSERTTKCDNGATRTVTEQAPGAVTRLSVSATVDDAVVEAAELPLVEESIAAAVGLNTARGDTLSVTRFPMDDQAKEAAEAALAEAAPEAKGGAMDIVRYVITLLIVALVLFFAWRAVKRSQIAAPIRVPLDLARIEASEAQALPATAVAGAELEPAMSNREREIAMAAERVAALEASVSPTQREVVELIDRQPDEVAQTLRTWLADRRG